MREKRGKRRQGLTGLVERQSTDARKVRVSKALWPASTRRTLALHHSPFKYGRLAVLSRCRGWFAGIMGNPLESGRHLPPVTPMPVEPPLVRVLETIDLSRTDVEDLFESQEERHTAELALDWKDVAFEPGVHHGSMDV